MEQPKLTIEEISRFIDGELSIEERELVAQKISECSTSEQLLSRLRELTSQISLNILASAPDQEEVTTDDCLSEEDILEIVEHNASPAKLAQAEQHIAGCHHCLLLILQNLRSAVSMNANNWQELPESLAKDSRIASISHIKRPDHCIERIEEQIGEINFNLLGNKDSFHQEFYKGRYTVTITVKKVDTSTASIDILLSYNNKAKSQTELTLIITPDGKQVFRGLTSMDGRALIRRVQPEDYLLIFKDLKARIVLKISSKL